MANVTKRAVLVGCNYPHTKFRLHGCIQDVQSIKRVIMDKFGFHETNIQVLTDDDRDGTPGWLPSSLPTGANIKAALNEMAKRAKAGDVLFFYFSGHGTAIPVLEAGRPFRQDEAIVPSDLNLVTDVDLRRFVNRLPEGVSFTILSDSCHSGVLIEKKKEQIGAAKKRKAPENPPKPKGKAEIKFLGFHFISHVIDDAAGFAHDGGNKTSQGAHKIFGKDVSLKFHPHYTGGAIELGPVQEDEGILLSGCEVDETSYDIVLGDQAFGAFTDAVVKFLNGHHLCATISNGQLLAGAAKKLEEQGYEYEQNPCLYCSDKNKSEPFLGGFV
ncbi:metacaspase 2f, metacaspase 9 [Hibiscus trionum]|uniref:Metacaspase 2f, metacaspase 9 n=1 Tax=Hibiscus trionum TaxID=183268 RepID=A0A9W7JGQ5_HIBTR|nr:metacaspase 2f, metacaspase 9 [Hibiscus trionum]